MKAIKIYYKELRTSSSYNNKECGIELEIAEGEKAADVLVKAKLFVQAALASENLNQDFLEDVVRRVKYASEAIENLRDKAQKALPIDDEIPF